MSNELQVPSYAELDQMLAQYGDGVNPVEIQGVIAGFCCGGQVLFGEALASAMLEIVGLDIYLNPELPAVLGRLADGVELELKDTEFKFSLLLPDEEEEEFFEQLCAFGLWCEAFMNGFSAACTDEFSFSEEVQGVLEDLMAFSRVAEDIDPNDKDELSFVELLEYTRIAVLTLYTELVLAPQDAAKRTREKNEKKEKGLDASNQMPPSSDLH